MALTLFHPRKSLTPFIDSYIVFENRNDLAHVPLTIVPNGCTEIAIHYGDPVLSYLNYSGEVTSGYLYGPHTQPGFFMARGAIRCFCVLFRPYGAYCMFGQPQIEFRNQAINLETLLGNQGKDFVEQISCAQSDERRAQIADSFFENQHARTRKQPVRTQHLSEAIQRSRGTIKITTLCRQLNMNIKTAERNLKHDLGLSPKEYASILRLNNAYRLMKTVPDADTQDVIYSCGYYDQSHFINECKHFTRFTPDILHKDPDNHVIYLNRLYTF